jgi:predicted negative regulator of RcsB-dependent stress response
MKRAAELSQAAYDLAVATGDTVVAASAQMQLAAAGRQTGSMDAAEAMLADVLQDLDRDSSSAEYFETLMQLAVARALRGRTDEALVLLDDAQAIAASLHNDIGEATIQFARGMVLSKHPTGRYEAAAPVREAIKIFRRHNLRGHERQCLDLLKTLPKVRGKR